MSTEESKETVVGKQNQTAHDNKQTTGSSPDNNKEGNTFLGDKALIQTGKQPSLENKKEKGEEVPVEGKVDLWQEDPKLKFSRLDPEDPFLQNVRWPLFNAADLHTTRDKDGKLVLNKDDEVPTPDVSFINRTVAVRPFDKENTTLEELCDHFSEVEPSCVHLAMRNHKKKSMEAAVFKGYIFMTFATEEAAKNFVESETKCYKDGTRLESMMVMKFGHIDIKYKKAMKYKKTETEIQERKARKKRKHEEAFLRSQEFKFNRQKRRELKEKSRPSLHSWMDY